MMFSCLCGRVWRLAAAVAVVWFAGAVRADPSGVFPYWSQQLPREYEECVSPFSRSGAGEFVRHLGYTLIPEFASHRGQAVDVYVGYRSRREPERLWLLRGGAARGWVEYRTGVAPASYNGDVALTLADRNAIVLIDAADGAPVNLVEALDQADLYVGYGLRDAADGAFKEMLDSQRFGWVATGRNGRVSGIVSMCLPYSRIWVRSKAGSGR